MPTRDIRSNLEGQLAFKATISSDTTTNGTIIDTANYDGGVVFFMFTTAYTDGTYTPALYESDDSGMSGATAIADKNLIGTEAGAALDTAVTATSEVIKSIGIVGTKRYVRLSFVSTSTSTGATVVAVAAKQAETLPISGLSA